MGEMTTIITTGAALVTFLFGVCLIGHWPSDTREQHTELPEVAARPRPHGRLRSPPPYRPTIRHRSRSRNPSHSPRRNRHRRSRLPKHVTYTTIVALFAFVTQISAVTMEELERTTGHALGIEYGLAPRWHVTPVPMNDLDTKITTFDICFGHDDRFSKDIKHIRPYDAMSIKSDYFDGCYVHALKDSPCDTKEAKLTDDFETKKTTAAQAGFSLDFNGQGKPVRVRISPLNRGNGISRDPQAFTLPSRNRSDIS